MPPLLNAAITAASNTTLYLPAGSFLTNAITLKPGVRIQGRGRENTQLLAGSNGITMFTYTAPGPSLVNHIGIFDLELNSNSKTTVTGIRIDGNTSAIRIADVNIKNVSVIGVGSFFATGIYLKYCAQTNLNDCWLQACVDGVTLDNCADTNLVAVNVQLGTGNGFNVIGGAGAFDEGIRMSACSTNGQNVGLAINGQDWGEVAGCSFTTCAGGAVITTGNVGSWKFSACDFSTATGAPAQPNMTMSAGCSYWSISGCQFAIGTFGLIARGNSHSITGNTFEVNSSVDIYLDAVTHSTIVGNVCRSTGAAWSILENGAADNNFIVGNKTDGLTTLVGANSVAVYKLGATTVFSGGIIMGGGAFLPGVDGAASLGTALARFNALHLYPGTATVAPINLYAGTSLSTPAAGAVEFDGKAKYFTPVANQRNVDVIRQFVRVQGSVVSLTNNIATAQAIFSAANDVITLPANTAYRFRAKIGINTGATTHTTAFGFGGTATITSCAYDADTTSAAASTTPATPQRVSPKVATATVLNATSTAVRTDIRLEGIICTNAAGTIIPQITFSAGPTGTCEIDVGSWFELEPIGADTVQFVGNMA